MADHPPILVRPAGPEDLDAVVEVTWQVGAEGRWLGIEVPFDRAARRAQLADSLGDLNREQLVAVVEGTVVGETVVGEIHLELTSYGVVNLGMALLEGWRGQGLGRLLLDQGIAWARRSGAHKVALELWPDNERASALYERAGFERDGRKRAHYRRRDGQLWDAVLMGLPLERTPHLVRPVVDADGWDLVALIAACWSEYPGCVMDAHGEYPELLAPASAYAAKGGAMWVIDGPEGPIASVALAPGKPGVIELQKLYVARRWRRKGLARQLIALVEAEAVDRGAQVVDLWSDTRFAAAHRCYEELGYRPGVAPRHLQDRSATVEFHYAKQLSPAAPPPDR